ncbi:uncharacterized protein FTOL_12116 [Fusarium torulosum]|uniref:Uncharacterized protein n=1 Tax=Fusarium torulosum TaxID=33205 RepID=A0AAE8MJZ3_9HYPO|nr:uncharacterized protein FTOL_12116 [Fusarium torulosum]
MHFNSIILPALFTIVRAADDDIQLTYATATITQCFTQGGLAVPTVTVVAPTCIIRQPAVPGGPIIVEVQAPDCNCGCPTCVHTLEYTTKYPAFCSTGLYDQEYVITETYKGMEAKPTMDHDLPFGFTYDVQTCTTCGPETVTATITYPVSDRPYINDVTYPTEMPIAVKPIDSDNGYEAPKDSKSEDDSHYPGAQGDSKPEGDSHYPGAQEGSKPEGGSYYPDSQPGSKSETEPYSPEGSVPAEGADNKPQGEAAPKAPAGDNNGFQSSVRPSSAADYPESAHPGMPSDLPVVVSGAAGRDLGLAGVAIVVAVVLESLFSL